MSNSDAGQKTFFQRYAVVLLCGVFFLLPFALRGARMALQGMKNDVKDWLPEDFPETRILEWFGQHFINERFVVLTWPGCSEDDPRYQLMVKKLQACVVTPDEERRMPTVEEALADPEKRRIREDIRARQLGDRLGLFDTGDYRLNWGGRQEKWLQGDGDTWYFITPDGKLYQWMGGRTALTLWRIVWHRHLRKLPVEGTLVADLSHEGAGPNRYYQDPRRITARYYSSVVTGPLVVEQLARPQGPLWPYGDVAESLKPQIARAKGYERLVGTLFGRPLYEGWDWTARQLVARLPKEKLGELPADWMSRLDAFLDELIRTRYQGDRQRLIDAPVAEQELVWQEAFAALGVKPPAPQTSFLVTLSEPGKRDMRRVVGRAVLGRPRGHLLALAEECSVSTDDENGELRLGGPPVDNVAIDEEGAITLVRLVGFCVALGIGLSYVCLRSLLVTFMVFLVGGMSAVVSLSIVYWTGWTVDAILMSMPSLVYVLGMSAAVHIVNYYRDACHERGLVGACEQALKHGWFPCTLCAFTTALGLLSLYASNLTPIRKFGLFSAIGVMATLAILYTYLPSALQIWPPGYHREKNVRVTDRGGASSWISEMWVAFGRWICRHNLAVAGVCCLLLVVVGAGMVKIKTSVQLLKLFSSDAKIIRDYRWLEEHVGELVPMELVVRVHPDWVRPTAEELAQREQEDPEDRFKLSVLERIEISYRIQSAVERVFGPHGQRIVGRGMSAATLGPEFPPAQAGGLTGRIRNIINLKLEQSLDELRHTDYLRIDQSPEHAGSELWRISLRVGALNDVDYGQFVHELKNVVEPVVAAYRYRDAILRAISEQRVAKGEAELGFLRAQVAFLGAPDPLAPAEQTVATQDAHRIDQTHLFCEALAPLLINAGLDGQFRPHWVSLEELRHLSREQVAQALASYDAVVLVQDIPEWTLDTLRQHTSLVIDARQHTYQPGRTPTSMERDDPIQVIYTGVVPVVYKAQRVLLTSLVESFISSFAMIAVVMGFLVSNDRTRWYRLVNIPGGLISMLPNVFPVFLVFGTMGHLGVLVDIGSMMTASVALGIAVDNTIHFLTWFRDGIRMGLSRHEAIEMAYQRCASAMTTTTIIGGLGLSVFILSTFTPTQRFGILMLTILIAALVGDLVMNPALLAGPLGRYFEPRQRRSHPREESKEGTENNAGSTADHNGHAVPPPHEVTRLLASAAATSGPRGSTAP